MDKTLEKRVQQLSAVIANKTDILSGQRIDKASYDKTLIGIVAEKIIPQNPKDDNDFKWQIQTNGAAYNISPAACNITEVGQRVRLYLPNHDYREKYAEVINNSHSIKKHPDRIIFDNIKDTITEIWQLSDVTEEKRLYALTVINKDTAEEEVTKITLPDGSEINLEGFVVG